MLDQMLVVQKNFFFFFWKIQPRDKLLLKI